VNLKPRFLAGLSQCLDEVLPIDIVQEDVLTPITLAQDVVDGTQLLTRILRGMRQNYSHGMNVKAKTAPTYG